MIWLIDSRGRLLDGKRYLWTWDECDVDANREAWRIVLRAEISTQVDRDDYGAFADHDMPNIYSAAAGCCETFNDFWSMYGWELCFMDQGDDDDDHPLAADMVIMNGEPARTCYANDWRTPRGFMIPVTTAQPAQMTDGKKIVMTPSGVSICSFCGGASTDENPHEDWCRYQ